MIKKIILLTGSELRHEFFRKYLSSINEIKVLATYCESHMGNLTDSVDKDNIIGDIRKQHLQTRSTYEKDFFEVFCEIIEDESNPIFIDRGCINEKDIVLKIINLNPDLIVSYGCSIIRSELLSYFKGRFINIHLGLSPYYRGSGTNYWPFVNNELHFVGTTFMHIDEGVDTGEIIHQIRAKMTQGDNIHQIGNRLIKDSVIECAKLIRCYNKLEKQDPIKVKKLDTKYYKKKDFTEESLKRAQINLSQGIIQKYLENRDKFENRYPIIKNQMI